jgi:ureidoglycolate lyase
MTILKPEPLTRAAFAAFGDVVEIDGASHYPINQGFAERFNDLASVDVGNEGGATNISIIIAKPRPQPIKLALMERHPLGSQIFYPLQDTRWLVAVCGDPRDATSFRAFIATGRQGVNYARNAWHHPLLVFEDDSRFMVVDRKGPGNNLEEMGLDVPIICGSLPQK